MLKQVYEIDKLGYLIAVHIANFCEDGNPAEPFDENIVTADPPHGLYRAKWAGREWIEDMSQEEIDDINNRPKELTESEMIMLAITDLDMQREQDKHY